MKRWFAFLIVLVLLLNTLTISGFAETNVEEKLTAYIRTNYPHVNPPYYDCTELYTHLDGEGEVDWILLFVEGSAEVPLVACGVFCHRVFFVDDEWFPFSLGMVVYDAKEDTFFDLAKPPKSVDYYEKYDDLAEICDKYGMGRLLGDIDNDNEISIIDVTWLQRYEAGMKEYPESDVVENYFCKYESVDTPLVYYSDFNRDGERDILDATCIQRFLAGLPYSIG